MNALSKKAPKKTPKKTHQNIPQKIPKQPKNKGIISIVCYWLAVGLGSGLAKKAPGTFGSLAALVFLPIWLRLGFVPSIIAILVLTLLGVYICDRASKDMGVHDSGHIVWDEWAGQWIALLPLIYWGNSSWLLIGLNFVLFRFFDILKPPPIRQLDKKVHGGFGIMIDDVLAGVFAAAVFTLIIAGFWLLGFRFWGLY